jgi:hypothetical protein
MKLKKLAVMLSLCFATTVFADTVDLSLSSSGWVSGGNTIAQASLRIFF